MFDCRLNTARANDRAFCCVVSIVLLFRETDRGHHAVPALPRSLPHGSPTEGV
jgi:hypothetical protein